MNWESMEVTAETKGDMSIISIFDAISIQNIQEIEKVWEQQLGKNIRILAIDFTGIERVDSIGLSHLVKLSRKAIIKEIDLIFFGLNPPITELFKIARLDTFFNILTKGEFEEKYQGR